MFELVIGLEVHVQLNTETKLFCGCKTSFGDTPNINTCPVCIGLPGALPVLNKQAVIKAINFGTSVGSVINNNSIFERKNYFYPDLPSGYQISQLDVPIVEFGKIIIDLDDGSKKTIRLNRAHLETDAGKSIHNSDHSLVDLNRSGTPLLEIVTEPDFRSSSEVTSYLKQLHSLVKYIDISDANMQEGSFRCDVNISIRPKGDSKLYTRSEIKNLNSFKFIEKAISYEFQRHVDAWEDGVYETEIVQETRLFDTNSFVTKPMRSKEEAMDYRYFPDPDLKEVTLTPDMFTESLNLPELPKDKAIRYSTDLHLNKVDIDRLILDPVINNIFETILGSNFNSKRIKNIISILLVELPSYSSSIDSINISIGQISSIIDLIYDNTISFSSVKKIIPFLIDNNPKDLLLSNVNSSSPIDITDVLDSLNLLQISDESLLNDIIDDVISSNLDSFSDFKNGNSKLLGSFVGKVMKATNGKANPQLVNKLIKLK